MEFIDKFWNRDIAHHPLNWLIVVVIVILFCFVLDAGHTLTGAPKPVTQMRNRNNAARNGVAQRNQRRCWCW
jgi:hypothetical protein